MSRETKSEEGLDVPITPMLDMAFQLLTFFILTYHPMPSEGQFAMNLMPASAVAKPVSDPSAAETSQICTLPLPLKTLPTTLRAGEGGALGRITLGDSEVLGGMDALKRELDSYFSDPTLPFDQTLIKVDPELKYSALVQVIDVFSRAFADAKKEPKLSFASLAPDEKEGS